VETGIGVSPREWQPCLPPKFRRGGETHVHDDYPVVTPGLGTGDFEGCARPSQPTIGIAAASLAAS